LTIFSSVLHILNLHTLNIININNVECI